MKVKKYLRKSYKDLGILFLRITVGCLMLFGHGIPKIMRFEESFHTFSNPIRLGSEASYVLTVFAEVFCSILVIIGLYTRLAILPLIITMLVAILIIHGDDPWNRKELATIFLMIYGTLFFTGGGKYGVDKTL